MSSNIVSYHLRIDENVLDNIRILAKKDGRSVNKHIEYILKQYIKEELR